MEWSLAVSCTCILPAPPKALSAFCDKANADDCDVEWLILELDVCAALDLFTERSAKAVPTNSSRPHVVFRKRDLSTSATGEIKLVAGMIWS